MEGAEMRTNKEIQKDIDAIDEMEESRDRLGFEIIESQSGTFEPSEGYYTVGKDVLRVAKSHPDQLDLIEEVIIAITGWGFGTLRERMKEHKDYFDSL